jgi:hypothetical protein
MGTTCNCKLSYCQGVIAPLVEGRGRKLVAENTCPLAPLSSREVGYLFSVFSNIFLNDKLLIHLLHNNSAKNGL